MPFLYYSLLCKPPRLAFLSYFRTSAPDLLGLFHHFLFFYGGLSSGTTVNLTGNRSVSGSLAGYDQFGNCVLRDASVEGHDGETRVLGTAVIRGSSIFSIEIQEGGG